MFTPNKPLVYLGCPYSHENLLVRRKRFQTINKIAAKLMLNGECIFSPISFSHPIAMQCDLPGNWEFWEEFDKKFISCCHKMYAVCMEGWKDSVGLQAEIKIAKNYKIPVIYLDENGEELKELNEQNNKKDIYTFDGGGWFRKNGVSINPFDLNDDEIMDALHQIPRPIYGYLEKQLSDRHKEYLKNVDITGTVK